MHSTIYHHARSIVLKLQAAGFIAYFAGGWVRDFLMGHPSEDIDIATDAAPVDIINLFPQTILVGLSFGVVIVIVEGYQFEVATFRKDLPYHDGRHPEGIEMSSPIEDAKRRDFTINGMFYDPLDEVVYDYVSGKKDIQRQVIKTIGDPNERFFEDRLRMLRAFRFASRFGFSIESETLEAIRIHADSLFPAVAMERVWQEFNKMAANPRFDDAIVEMHKTGLLSVIFPELATTHVHKMREQVRVYAYFPKDTPTILYLLELFPALNLNQKIEILQRLKVSNKDIEHAQKLEKVISAIENERQQEAVDLCLWAKLFAMPDYQLYLNVLSARYGEQERELFLNKYKQRLLQLHEHVERIYLKKPLVNADLLQVNGIKPGKQMGRLLEEAEKLVITLNLKRADEALNLLKQQPIWSACDGK